MAAEFDPDAAMATAVAEGLKASDLYDRLNRALERCYAAADKVKGIIPHESAWEACLALDQQVTFVQAHLDEIDQKISASTGMPPSEEAPDQRKVDTIYGDTYFHYFGKGHAAQDKYDKLVKTIRDEGMTPEQKAMIDALWDVLHNIPYYPPLWRPGYPPRNTGKPAKPINPFDPNYDPGDPNYSDAQPGAQGMAAASERQAPRRGGARRDGLMPVIDYWLVGARREPTVHFAATCPACAPEQAQVMSLDVPEHPLALADRLGAHACGSCLRILASDNTKGFLFGTALAGRMLQLYRDHIEYTAAGLFGYGATDLTIPAEDVRAVRFATFRRIVILSTTQGSIRMPLRDAGELELAREAFRRMGWQV